MSRSTTRGVLLLSVLVLLFVAPLEAQKRRAVASGPPGAPNPGGNCHTYPLVKPGTKATYLTTSPGGNVNFTVTYVAVSTTQTRTTQAVTTPQGSADVETTIDTEVVGELMATKRILTLTTTTVPIVGKLTTEVEITFSPSLVIGPAAGWCQGTKWTIPAVTETIVVRASIAPPQTTIVTTVASEGEVLAVGESITVPAGTFNTVKHKSLVLAGDTVSPTISWMSMDHNVTVRQDTLDAGGNVTSRTELTNLQVPASARLERDAMSPDW